MTVSLVDKYREQLRNGERAAAAAAVSAAASGTEASTKPTHK